MQEGRERTPEQCARCRTLVAIRLAAVACSAAKRCTWGWKCLNDQKSVFNWASLCESAVCGRKGSEEKQSKEEKRLSYAKVESGKAFSILQSSSSTPIVGIVCWSTAPTSGTHRLAATRNVAQSVQPVVQRKNDEHLALSSKFVFYLLSIAWTFHLTYWFAADARGQRRLRKKFVLFSFLGTLTRVILVVRPRAVSDELV